MNSLGSNEDVNDQAPAGTLGRLLFRLRGWILAGLILLWIAAVTGSHIPQEQLPELPLGGKVLHAIGFFSLAIMLALTLLAYRFHRGGWRRDLLVLLLLAAYAAFDEGTQPYFHRHGQVSDWLLDTVSAAVALASWRLLSFPIGLLVRHVRQLRQDQRENERYLDAYYRHLAPLWPTHADYIAGTARPRQLAHLLLGESNGTIVSASPRMPAGQESAARP